jgi:hypothetical protein
MRVRSVTALDRPELRSRVNTATVAAASSSLEIRP